MSDATIELRESPRWFWPALILLALSHFAIALFAVRTKSVTYDEPLHTVGGWTVNQFNDFRLEPENPILFERFTGLLSRPDELNLTQDSEEWKSFLHDPKNTFPTLFAKVYPPPVDIDSMVNRRRPMFAMLGSLTVIGVGALTRNVARRFAKSDRSALFGALCAAGLIAFNPTLLGHSPLVKNDVILALVMTLIALALWRVIDRVTILNVTLLALAVSLAPLVKFSGIICGPVVALSLVIRAVMREPWSFRSRQVFTRSSKMLLAASITIFAGLVSYLMIWTAYGFRYHATLNGEPLNVQWLIDLNRTSKFFRDSEMVPPDEWLPFLDVDHGASVLLTIHQWKIFPEPFTYGLFHVYAMGQNRYTFLLGERSHHPSVWYFPISFALKEPLGTLALIAGLPIVVLRNRLNRQDGLRLLCLALPGLGFLFTSIFGPLNIGLRHILPVYPTIFAMFGLMIALTWHTWARFTFISFAALSAIESLARAPDFIAFFNVAAGGPNAGARYLCDSNIDWGQDLKLLRQWQQDNPQERLYLSYFGVTDPTWYGLRYEPFFSRTGEPDPLPSEPGVVAISVYDLRGMSMNIHQSQLDLFEHHEPFKILGGSIYLYRWPFAEKGEP